VHVHVRGDDHTADDDGRGGGQQPGGPAAAVGGDRHHLGARRVRSRGRRGLRGVAEARQDVVHPGGYVVRHRVGMPGAGEQAAYLRDLGGVLGLG
jgi:hypothetical protein